MPPKTRRSSRMIRCPPGRKSKPNTAKKRKGKTPIPRASASNSDSDESSDSDVEDKEDKDDDDAYEKKDNVNDEEDEALSILKKQDASVVVTKPVKSKKTRKTFSDDDKAEALAEMLQLQTDPSTSHLSTENLLKQMEVSRNTW